MNVMYISASISIVFMLAIAGMLVNNALQKQPFYTALSHLNFIKSNRANKYLGVIALRYLILNSFWKKFNPGLKLDNAKGQQKLEWLRQEMTNAEISHLAGFILGLALILLSYITGMHTGIMLPLFVANVLFHFYPVLLQQYNKRRIDKLLGRINKA